MELNLLALVGIISLHVAFAQSKGVNSFGQDSFITDFLKPKGPSSTRTARSNINLNIIVVHVLHESDSGEGTRESARNGKMQYLRPREPKAGQGVLTGQQSQMGFPPRNEDYDDLDTQETSYYPAYQAPEASTPAAGIIDPARCSRGHVYDSELGQCIRRPPPRTPGTRRPRPGRRSVNFN